MPSTMADYRHESRK